MNTILPNGKLPPDLLQRLISSMPHQDPRVLLGPGIGLDCAVVEPNAHLLVFKSDPITFATDEIGWYAVQVNTNDIATTGAIPRWFLVTTLLPGGQTTAEMVEKIGAPLSRACSEIGVTVIGGHTEITSVVERPVMMGTMIGEVARDRLITPRGAQTGDLVLLTKGVPIEATAILAREFHQKLLPLLGDAALQRAQAYLYDPGISILREAQTATQSGRVTAMHDPTEGGVAAALWELAEASACTLHIDPQKINIPSLSAQICQVFDIEPLAAIASGALLLTVQAEDGDRICSAIEKEGIPCSIIGRVETGPPEVWQTTPQGRSLLPRPERDELARIFE